MPEEQGTATTTNPKPGEATHMQVGTTAPDGSTPKVEPVQPVVPGGSMVLTVDGKDLIKTTDEVVAAAQKHYAGDDRLAKAAEARKVLQDDTSQQAQDAQIGALLRKAHTDEDMGAYAKLITGMGYSQEDANTMIQNIRDAKADAEGAGGAAGTGQAAEDPRVGEVIQKVDQLEARLGLVDQDYMSRLREQVKGKVFAQVDNDPVLGKMTKKPGPRADEVREEVWEAVQNGTRIAGSYQPEVLEAALTKVRGRVKNLGIGEDTERPVIPGAGPSGGLSATFSPEKPFERVSVTDSTLGQNVLEEMARFIEDHAGEN